MKIISDMNWSKNLGGNDLAKHTPELEYPMTKVEDERRRNTDPKIAKSKTFRLTNLNNTRIF